MHMDLFYIMIQYGQQAAILFVHIFSVVITQKWLDQFCLNLVQA